MPKNQGDCSNCKFCGVSTTATSIAPALTERAARMLERTNRMKAEPHCYCVQFDRPVPFSYGRNCSKFRPDH
jgi:hypothetical protein